MQALVIVLAMLGASAPSPKPDESDSVQLGTIPDDILELAGKASLDEDDDESPAADDDDEDEDEDESDEDGVASLGEIPADILAAANDAGDEDDDESDTGEGERPRRRRARTKGWHTFDLFWRGEVAAGYRRHGVRLTKLESAVWGRFHAGARRFRFVAEGEGAVDGVFYLDSINGPGFDDSDAERRYGTRGRLQELTANLEDRSWQLSIGAQHVVWGKSFLFRVADRVNPLDLRQWFLADFLAVRLVLPMIRWRSTLGPIQTDAFVSPFPRFQRWPAIGSEFDLSPALPAGAGILLPSRYRPQDAELGFRVAYVRPRGDLGLSLHRGWHQALVVSDGSGFVVAHPQVISGALDASVRVRAFVLRLEALGRGIQPVYPAGRERAVTLPRGEGAALAAVDWQPAFNSSWSLETTMSTVVPSAGGMEIGGAFAGLVGSQGLFRDQIVLGIRAMTDLRLAGAFVMPSLRFAFFDRADFIVSYTGFYGRTSPVNGPLYNHDRVSLAIELNIF
ncbi:MAG: hypothetical protein KC501_27735 [Myxococcales bacterium]|nr:hypothetical protein [Myxococcales bacterium]